MESPEDMAEASYLGSSAVKARPLAEEAEASDPKGDQATTAAVPEPEVAPKGEERVVTQVPFCQERICKALLLPVRSLCSKNNRRYLWLHTTA